MRRFVDVKSNDIGCFRKNLTKMLPPPRSKQTRIMYRNPPTKAP
jgi:hypothetical protein